MVEYDNKGGHIAGKATTTDDVKKLVEQPKQLKTKKKEQIIKKKASEQLSLYYGMNEETLRGGLV